MKILKVFALIILYPVILNSQTFLTSNPFAHTFLLLPEIQLPAKWELRFSHTGLALEQ